MRIIGGRHQRREGTVRSSTHLRRPKQTCLLCKSVPGATVAPCKSVTGAVPTHLANPSPRPHSPKAYPVLQLPQLPAHFLDLGTKIVVIRLQLLQRLGGGRDEADVVQRLRARRVGRRAHERREPIFHVLRNEAVFGAAGVVVLAKLTVFSRIMASSDEEGCGMFQLRRGSQAFHQTPC